MNLTLSSPNLTYPSDLVHEPTHQIKTNIHKPLHVPWLDYSIWSSPIMTMEIQLRYVNPYFPQILQPNYLNSNH